MEVLLLDLRFAVRMMLKHRAVTIVAIISIAFGISANTAIFSVVNAIMLRPLPFSQPERLVRVRQIAGNQNDLSSAESLSPVVYKQWREYNQVFEDIGGATGISLNLTGSGEPEYVPASLITPNFFDVVGIKPILGRNFLTEEAQPGKNSVVILGYGLWQQRFGGDANILGRSVKLNGIEHTVIGVMPAKFTHPYNAKMWLPLVITPDFSDQLYAPARLKAGVTVAQAQQSLNELAERIDRNAPSPNNPTGAFLKPLREELIHELKPKLYTVFAAALLLLLIAGANVANLLLVQLQQRRNEIAIRTALGARRSRLVRQFLTQSLLIAFIGCFAGILLAWWSIDPLIALSPINEGARNSAMNEFDAGVRIDQATLIFTILLTALIGLIFGLLPAIKASRLDLNNYLKEGGRLATADPTQRRVLSALVITEVAIAAILLIGGGLLWQSFRHLQNQPIGFNPERLLTFDISFADARYPEARQRTDLVIKAAQQLREQPGVFAVSATTTQPLFPGTMLASFNVEGQPSSRLEGYYLTHDREIIPDYFFTMGIPILQGRDFTADDRNDNPMVVIVSRSFAEKFWPNQEALGKRIKRGRYNSNNPWLTVVGVVGDVKESSDDLDGSISGTWYLPLAQSGNMLPASMSFVVRSQDDNSQLMNSIRDTIWSLDKDQSIYNVASMKQLFQESLIQERFSALLLGIFGILGLFLASVGVYTIISFSVTQQTREIGVRLALGAKQQDIFLMVIKKGLKLTFIGIGIGVLISMMLNRFIISLLFVTPMDLRATFCFSALTLAIIALLACYLPARRAAGIDPIIALRFE